MSQSAEDALRLLKAKIESDIEETRVIINNCISRNDYALALELDIKVQERKDIIYIINDMLDKEEKHTHKWKWQNGIGFHCDCGIILSIKEVEKRLNLDDNLYVGGNFTIHKEGWRPY